MEIFFYLFGEIFQDHTHREHNESWKQTRYYHNNRDYNSSRSRVVIVKLPVGANNALLDTLEIVAAIRGISTIGTNPI